MVHGNFDRLCLSSSRFSGNENGLILATKGKTLVTKRRNFIDMRLDELSDIRFAMIFPDEFVGIFGTNFLRVDFLEPLKGVTGDDNVTCSGVRFVLQVTCFQVVEDGSL
jgi:hypothetical protein